MSQPLVVSIPHRLGREEAMRRIRSGFGNVRAEYSSLMTLEEESWQDNRLNFRVRTLGQSAAGTIEVLDDALRIEVVLPWLLSKLTERIAPAIRRSGTLMLEKK